MLYSGPSGPSVLRRDMRLHASDDGGATYSELATIDGGAVGYSSLALPFVGETTGRLCSCLYCALLISGEDNQP